jgi:hypothetical protein
VIRLPEGLSAPQPPPLSVADDLGFARSHGPGCCCRAARTFDFHRYHGGDFTGAASAGFDLADVSTLSALRAVPEGMKGVYWLGNGYKFSCSWRLSDRQITDTVMAIKDNRS